MQEGWVRSLFYIQTVKHTYSTVKGGENGNGAKEVIDMDQEGSDGGEVIDLDLEDSDGREGGGDNE